MRTPCPWCGKPASNGHGKPSLLIDGVVRFLHTACWDAWHGRLAPGRKAPPRAGAVR